jgi:hypothetical protein
MLVEIGTCRFLLSICRNFCTWIQQLGVFYLKAIVSPWTELHKARLLVEREVPYVDLAGWLEDCWRSPDYLACVVKHSLGHCGDDILSVRAATFEQRSSLLHTPIIGVVPFRNSKAPITNFNREFSGQLGFPNHGFEVSAVLDLCAVFKPRYFTLCVS